jgi:hypothetical protein
VTDLAWGGLALERRKGKGRSGRARVAVAVAAVATEGRSGFRSGLQYGGYGSAWSWLGTLKFVFVFLIFFLGVAIDFF